MYRAMTHQQWTLLQQSGATRKPKKRKKPTGRKPSHYKFMDGRKIAFECDSLTRSEARALYKQHFKVDKVSFDVIIKVKAS